MDSRIPKELQSKVFELTLALYRVTDFFPGGEVLRRYLRERANEVFGIISEYGYGEDPEQQSIRALSKIESIKGYLLLARSLHYVKPINLMVLEREYGRLADFFSEELQKDRREFREEIPHRETVQKPEPAKTEPSHLRKELKIREPKEPKSVADDLTDRQKKILDYIGKVTQAKISDFFSFFTDISTKTIQRDLQDLVNKNILRKEGEKRWTVYSKL